jgi:two-component system cell cycle sensor histidine kinase/response regulator CckA
MSEIPMEKRQPCLLVVDDTDANRYAVVRHLKAMGLTVEEASNGKEALSKVKAINPDLIILDIRMPDMNGFEVTRILKSDERTSGIPVLHISASFTDPASMARGLENGADGYLTHPVDSQILMATVKSLLRARDAEREVRAAAGRWQATFDAIGEGVCITDKEGHVQRCNRAFHGLLDLEPITETKKLWEVSPELGALINHFLKHGGETHAERVEINDRTLRVSASPIQREDGVIDSFVWVITDLTRERLFDERVRRALQLETTGRLAGGVAHEINNMMTAILSYAEFALRGSRMDDPRRADIEGIHKAATRSAEVARQLLTFSRRQVINPKTVDLHVLIREMRPTLLRLLGADKTLIIELAAKQPWVTVDPLGIEQILINLALNARDAMPLEGRFEIKTSNVILDDAMAARYKDVAIQTGPYIQMSICDTGHGMDQETLQHVFEPFYTTKEVGKGTGLGLATVYGMVKQSAGYIWAESQPGRGAEFTVQLPQVEAVSPERISGPHSDTTPASGTLMVVEDEQLVLSLLSRSLREAGYHVLEAADGRAALERMIELQGRVDGVVTDIIMPRLNGRELASEIRTRWPGMPILFISGYTAEEVVGRGLINRGEAFLQKPFDPRGIAAKVKELLAAATVTQP